MKKKIYWNAPFTLGLVACCGVVLLLQYMLGDKVTLLFFSTYRSSLLDPLMYLRLIGHIFGHQDVQHLLNNCAYLLLLGPILEEKYGAFKMMIITVVVAVVTGVLHNIFQGNVILLGSSGLCFAFILLASITGKEKGIPITLLLAALFWIGQEVYAGVVVQDNISQATHILGGLSGACLGMYFKKEKKYYHLR